MGKPRLSQARTWERQWISWPVLLPGYRARECRQISWRLVQKLCLCVHKYTWVCISTSLLLGWVTGVDATPAVPSPFGVSSPPCTRLHKLPVHRLSASSSSSQLTSWDKTAITKLARAKITAPGVSKHHHWLVNALDVLLWVCNALARGAKQRWKAQTWVYTEHAHDKSRLAPWGTAMTPPCSQGRSHTPATQEAARSPQVIKKKKKTGMQEGGKVWDMGLAFNW